MYILRSASTALLSFPRTLLHHFLVWQNCYALLIFDADFLPFFSCTILGLIRRWILFQRQYKLTSCELCALANFFTAFHWVEVTTWRGQGSASFGLLPCLWDYNFSTIMYIHPLWDYYYPTIMYILSEHIGHRWIFVWGIWNCNPFRFILFTCWPDLLV